MPDAPEPTPEEKLGALLERTIDKVLDRRAEQREADRARKRGKAPEPKAKAGPGERPERGLLDWLWE